jgi:hypothetical protein
MMSIFAPMASPVTRYIGFALVVLGAAGLSIGYVGWKDAATRNTALGQNNTTVTRAAPKVTIKRLSPTTNKSFSTSAPRATARQSPTQKRLTQLASAKPASSPAVAPSRKLATMQRTMTWSFAPLLIGLTLVSISLYERPPKLPRSGADELLRNDMPF